MNIVHYGSKSGGRLGKTDEMGRRKPTKSRVARIGGLPFSESWRGGNTTASMLSGMGSEYINSEIANYLQENTALTADERNAIQQASSAGLGALIGAGLGGDSNVVKQSAQMALRTEKFNRQLHPDEKQRIKDLAKGDKEKEARLTVAGCALVRCSAQIPKDEPDYAEAYAKAKAMEDLGNSAEFANERALLSTQFADYDSSDSVSGYRRQLFQYNETQAGLDKLNRVDTKYGVTTRVSGLAQATGGVATTVFGVGLCESGIGCVASVPVAAYGVDNVVAGARAVYSGKNQLTFGAKGVASLTGINQETAELIYSVPSMFWGGTKLVKGAKNTGENVYDKLGGIEKLSPYQVRFSQSSVSFDKIDRSSNLPYTYIDLRNSMSKSGWKGEAIDVVKMSDGKLTSIDNTRLVAAKETLTEIKAVVHNYDDRVPFNTRISRQWKSDTWGKVVEERINKQTKTFRTENPQGSTLMPSVNKKGGEK